MPAICPDGDHLSGMTSTRLITVADAQALLELLARNREFLAPWEPTREPEFFTLDGQRAAIQRTLSAMEQGVALPHVMVDEDRRCPCVSADRWSLAGPCPVPAARSSGLAGAVFRQPPRSGSRLLHRPPGTLTA
jgi:hypothetical protein